ncbi:hypothetical protein BC629DRAFT_1435540 [Irpex lacteus]|nr:hypothetical protein BC629DRAFT_1435540 [Irpex lacteus]
MYSRFIIPLLSALAVSFIARVAEAVNCPVCPDSITFLGLFPITLSNEGAHDFVANGRTKRSLSYGLAGHCEYDRFFLSGPRKHYLSAATSMQDSRMTTSATIIGGRSCVVKPAHGTSAVVAKGVRDGRAWSEDSRCHERNAGHARMPVCESKVNGSGVSIPEGGTGRFGPVNDIGFVINNKYGRR